MEKLAQELKNKLGEITTLYRRFLELLTLEQAALTSGNTMEHVEVVRDKEIAAEQIQVIEEERLQILEQLAGALKIDRRSLKVAEIADRLPRGAGQELLKVRNELQKVLAQVKALNEINNQLLSDSMAYVRSALELVAGKQDLRQGYGQGGTIKTSVNVKRNLINTRA